MKKFLAVLMALLLVCCGAMADEKMVRVSGNATVSLAADRVEVQIGINTKADAPSAAQQENNAITNRVMATLKALGLEDKDMATSNFSIYSYTEYVGSVLTVEKTVYNASNTLTVQVKDITRCGEVLSAAIEAGASQIYGFNFGSSQESEAYEKALVRAVEDAARKAQVLTAAAGKTLGELVEIECVDNSGYWTNTSVGVTNTLKTRAEAEDAIIIRGDLTVSASVVLTYQFE